MEEEEHESVSATLFWCAFPDAFSFCIVTTFFYFCLSVSISYIYASKIYKE